MKIYMSILFTFLIILLPYVVRGDMDIQDPEFRPPQWTTNNRPLCSLPKGCLGYNLDTNKMEFWNGSGWFDYSVDPNTVINTGIATPTAIATFKDTSGKEIVNSGITIDSTNNLYGTNNLTIKGISSFNFGTSNSFTAPTTRGLIRQSFNSNGDGTSSWTDNNEILNWTQGLTYRNGEQVLNGTLIARSIGNNLSTDFTYDYGKGYWNFISNLDFGTSLISGGLVTINANNLSVDVATGMGIYTDNVGPFSIAPYPVSFSGTVGLVPAGLGNSTYSTIYVQPNGLITSTAGQATQALYSSNVVLATVRHNTSAKIDYVSMSPWMGYNTNSQLRNLMVFEGYYKKGIELSPSNANNLTLDRSAGELLLVGANYPDKNIPNVTQVIAQNSFNFSQLNSVGVVTSSTNTVDNQKFQSNQSGALSILTDGYWTWEPVFWARGINYIQYGNGQFQTEALAREDLTNNYFKFPKNSLVTDVCWAATIIFQKGVPSTTNANFKYVNYGGKCQSGSGSSGGGGSNGSVTGPASSVPNDIATFGDTSGTVLKDSGKAIADVVLSNKASVTDGNLPSYSGTSGTLILDSSIAKTNIAQMPSLTPNNELLTTNGVSKNLISSGILFGNVAQATSIFTTGKSIYATGAKTMASLPYGFPSNSCSSGNILLSNGTDWICNAPVFSTTTVTYPSISAVITDIPYFLDDTGKVLADSGLKYTDLVSMLSNPSGTGRIVQTTSNKQVSDSGVAIANLTTKSGGFTAANRAVISAGSSTALGETPYTLPTDGGTAGYILKTNVTSTYWALDHIGDLSGPSTSTIYDLPYFTTTSGQNLGDTGVDYRNIVQKSAPFSASATNKVVTAIAGSRNLSESIYGWPTTCTTGYMLTLSGTDFVCTAVPPSGVTSPSGVIVSNLAAYNNTNGQILKDSGIPSSNVMTKTATALANRVPLTVSANNFTETPYTFPNSVPTANQILKSDGSANLTWINVPSGTVTSSSAGVLDNFVSFSDSSGTIIKNSGWNSTMFTQISPSYSLNPGKVALKSGDTNNSAITFSPYTFPITVCSSGNILKSDGTNFTCNSDIVTMPAGVSTIGNLPSFSLTTGRSLQDSGIASGNLVTSSGNIVSGDIPIGNGVKGLTDSGILSTNIAQLQGTVPTVANKIVVTSANSKIVTAGLTLPAGNGTLNQLLASNADGTLVWGAPTPTIPTCNGSQRLSGNGSTLSCISNTYQMPTLSTATYPIDFTSGHIFYVNPTTNFTIQLANGVAGQTVSIVVYSALGYTISWTTSPSTSIKWPSGTIISTTKVAAYTVFTAIYVNGVYLIVGVEDLK